MKPRSGGRSFNELRPFQITLDPMGFALSSLIIRTGLTSVLCSVCLREGVHQTCVVYEKVFTKHLFVYGQVFTKQVFVYGKCLLNLCCLRL